MALTIQERISLDTMQLLEEHRNPTRVAAILRQRGLTAAQAEQMVRTVAADMKWAIRKGSLVKLGGGALGLALCGILAVTAGRVPIWIAIVSLAAIGWGAVQFLFAVGYSVSSDA